MVLKVLAILLAIFLVYIFFFKKSREDVVNNKKDDLLEDDLVECPTCKTYVSQKEAILSNSKFYCSKECLINKDKK